MRRVLVVVAVLGMTLGVASPAYAKGPVDATVTGPGFAAAVRVGYVADAHHKAGLDELSQATRLWDLLSGTGALAPGPPRGELGDRYDVTFEFGCVVAEGDTECGPERLKARLELYPLAAAGPHVYAPPDQAVYGMQMPNGWLPADVGLVRTLEAFGAVTCHAFPVSTGRGVANSRPAVARTHGGYSVARHNPRHRPRRWSGGRRWPRWRRRDEA